ncbi:MAG: hypothetical protein IJA86_01530 [Clostridia bacterium]|nr:hypothetical protein [Clostridia bacterium]
MTEFEKIRYAKLFIDKMANGINPLDNTPIPEGELLNHVRISRCLFYVSDLLEQMATFGTAKKKSEEKLPFFATEEQIAAFDYALHPLNASEIIKRLEAVIQNPHMKSVSVQLVNQWLVAEGYLYIDNEVVSGKPQKMPTQKGEGLGITATLKEGKNGPYMLLQYSTRAQKFMVKNINAIAQTGKKQE